MKTKFIILGTLLCLVPGLAQAQNSTIYWPFTVLSVNETIVEDVVIEGDDIYVKVSQDFWDIYVTVKLSNEYMEGYRSWLNGDMEMPIKVYRSQKRNKQGHTYRINTSAKFVEYWYNGELILHLERLE